MTDPWKSHHMRYGGQIAEIPTPHLRMFPKKGQRREVRVSITVFYGIGRHLHVDLVEDHNPIWNPADQVWQWSWDDPGGHGRTFSRKFATEGAARRFIQRTLARHFPRSTHRAKMGLSDKPKRWFYRDGD